MSVTERLEHSGSAGPTTLAAEISPSTMTLSLTDATGYPTGAVGLFVVCLGRGTLNEERVLCTSRSGNSVTVDTRGYDGTVARTHNAGAEVEHTFSAAEADQANAHTSSTSEHGVTGAVVGDTDTQTLTNKTLTQPVIADFTSAQHDHGDADDGGNIPQASVTGLPAALTALDTATDDHIADVSAHGVAVAVVGTTDSQTLTNKTLTTPTIGSLTNAQHTHGNAAGGGLLPVYGVIRTCGDMNVADNTTKAIVWTSGAVDALSGATPWEEDHPDHGVNGWWDGGTPREFNIPVDGIYAITCYIQMADGDADGRRTLELRLGDISDDGSNGTRLVASNPSTGHAVNWLQQVSYTGPLFTTDSHVSAAIFQNSGAVENLVGGACFISIFLLGTL